MQDQIQQMQTLLQKALVKINSLESELNDKKNNFVNNQPIAIIATAMRLPNGIEKTQQLWNLIYNKQSTIQTIPNDRFDIEKFYANDASIAGKTNVKYGSFLSHNIKNFDAGFFNISPREAKSLDPIQRLLLEITYEAFENAGIASDTLKGTKTGVFVAIGNSDYIQAKFRSGNLEDIDAYDSTGIPFATIAGRLSYINDWNGNSFAIDAACSSVLVGVHLASQALQKKEIDCAVVVSANLLLTPESFIALSKLGSLTSTNQCKTFDNNADGYIRGEGAGVLILKRLEDAQNNNDNIEIIVKGSAIKHGGTSNGFTAPNPTIQTAVIAEALLHANLQPNDIDYVELHGVGNKFTDALEIQAIHNAYKNKNNKIYVGSIKPNIGNLEAATGMTMVFKTIEAIKNKTIPANINITELNKDVSWDKINVTVPLENIEWKNINNQPLRAAINLSGYSGTNVHTIFEEAPQKQKSEEINAPYIFNLSAKTNQALKDLVAKYLQDISIFDTHTLTEICYTLAVGRNQLDHKLSILANTKQDIIDGLNAFIKDENHPNLIINFPENIGRKDVVFLFTGQGSQYWNMCKGFYETNTIFKKHIDECEAILQKIAKYSIKEILWSTDIDKTLITQTKYTQPAIFVVEYALAKMMENFGIQATVLLGHSIGEIVALTFAQSIQLKDALQIVTARAMLMQSIQNDEGTMAAVFCDEVTISSFLQPNKIELAAINTPKNITIAGKKEDLLEVINTLQQQNIKAVLLNVSHAFHSYLMEPILEKFEQFVGQFSFSKPTITVVSNSTGKEILSADLTPKYFSNHIRNTIQFVKGIEYCKNEIGADIYIEIGANPILVNLAKHTLGNENNLFLFTNKKDNNNIVYIYTILQQLYLKGFQLNWENIFENKKINRVQLPTYAWQWKEYWHNPVRQQNAENIKKEIKNTNNQPTNQPNIDKNNLYAYMQIEAAKVLGLEAGQKIDGKKTFREQGFDSMMSGEYLMLMEKYIRSELKMEIIHLYPTPTLLHQYLIDTYFDGEKVDTNASITMADIMFDSNIGNFDTTENWHEIKETDGILMRLFKKFDKKLPSVKK